VTHDSLERDLYEELCSIPTIEKIANDTMSRSEASLVARRLMFDNPRDFYLSKVR
jgi:hypothetical protein